MNYERFLLKESEQTQVRLFNLLLCHNNEYETTDENNHNVMLQLNPGALVGGEAEYVVLDIMLGSEKLILAISNTDLLEWVNSQFYVTSFSALTEDIVLAICEKTLSVLWKWLQDACSEKLVLKTWAPKKGESFAGKEENHFSLRLSFPEDGSPAQSKRVIDCLLIKVSPEKTEQLIRYFPLLKPKHGSWDYLLWPVWIGVGYSRLKINVILGIQQGDIIFFQHVPEENCLFMYITPLLHLVCRITENNMLMVIQKGRDLMNSDDDLTENIDEDWTKGLESEEDEGFLDDDFFSSLESEEQKENQAQAEKEGGHKEEAEDPLREAEEVKAPDDEPEQDLPPKKKVAAKTQLQEQEVTIKPKDLSVLLSFDVGSTTLSLDQLQSIKQGYCFELVNDFNDYITLRVHGQIIARGELVKVGDRLGVEVTKLGSKIESL